MATVSPSPAASPDARPVDARERVILLDVLRGFALCGVFISNAYAHFSGRHFLSEARLAALNHGGWDVGANLLFEYLLSEKAMSLFSFLFGLGFAVQLMRAGQRGDSVVPVYTRRLGVMLCLGLTHLFALWYGDILSVYAQMGFVLLLLRGLSERRLLVWAGVLILGAPLVMTALLKLVPLWASTPDVVREATQESAARVLEAKGRAQEAFSSGSYLTTARANADFYLHVFLKPTHFSYMLIVLGRFLLGLVAGRRRLLHDVERHLSFFRGLWKWGLGLALVGNGAVLLWRYGVDKTRLSLPLDLAGQILQPALWELGVLGLAGFYLAGFALLFQRARWRRVLGVLAPAGQMALTNYLSQTLISQFVFYGYGFNLHGRLSPSACLLLMFGLFWVQVAWSHLWLARFRFGPVEWVWRSLTYGRAQPMRREAAGVLEVAGV